MPAWIEAGFAEYQKRFPPFCRLELVEISLNKQAKESSKILSTIKPSHHVVALDIKGNAWSTEQLAQQIKNWQLNGRNMDMLIGGPDGLSKECLEKAETKWSLSPLTLPHPFVRVLVAEQLYRGLSILQNHPYHRI
jgi:23S rRNA (pseudouridine1915-N3)-methyltransferase